MRLRRKRVWQPDISKGFAIEPPPGWEIVSATLEGAFCGYTGRDSLTITLRRLPT